MMSDKVTIEDMENAIKQVESEGYIDVKVTHCHLWKWRFGAHFPMITFKKRKNP